MCEVHIRGWYGVNSVCGCPLSMWWVWIVRYSEFVIHGHPGKEKSLLCLP